MENTGNPITQRIVHFHQKWKTARQEKDVSLIRIVSEETDMVEAFIHYLFGVDNDSKDVPLILDTPFTDLLTFSEALLQEVEELVYLWNHVEENTTGMELPPVNWKADYTLRHPNNPAQLFTENINRLKNALNLQDAYFVLVFEEETVRKKAHLNWFEYALETELEKEIKFLVSDTPSNPYFEKITRENPKKTVVLSPRFSMDEAMQQMAATGNPNDPVVCYRKAFTVLAQAVGKRDKKAVKKYSRECFEIAKAQLPSDANWYGQFIAVYTLLINDQVGYKNYRNGIVLATRSVEIAESTFVHYQDDLIPGKFLAQTLMTRGSLYTMTKKWEACYHDFSRSFAILSKAKEPVLAIECARMCGYAGQKTGSLMQTRPILLNAYELAKNTPVPLVRTSTFGGVIEYLLKIDLDRYIDPKSYTEFFTALYGEPWQVRYKNWKKPTDKPVINEQEWMMPA